MLQTSSKYSFPRQETPERQVSLLLVFKKNKVQRRAWLSFCFRKRSTYRRGACKCLQKEAPKPILNSHEPYTGRNPLPLPRFLTSSERTCGTLDEIRIGIPGQRSLHTRNWCNDRIARRNQLRFTSWIRCKRSEATLASRNPCSFKRNMKQANTSKQWTETRRNCIQPEPPSDSLPPLAAGPSPSQPHVAPASQPAVGINSTL